MSGYFRLIFLNFLRFLVSVVNQQPVFATQTSMRPHILPKSGLSYLEGVPSVHINQTFELNECKKTFIMCFDLSKG